MSDMYLLAVRAMHAALPSSLRVILAFARLLDTIYEPRFKKFLRVKNCVFDQRNAVVQLITV
jgi:hypothetical protein